MAQELAHAGGEAGRLLPALAARLEEWRRGGFHIILVCLSRHRAERLAQLLREEKLDAAFTLNPSWQPGGRWRSPWGNSPGGSACSPRL